MPQVLLSNSLSAVPQLLDGYLERLHAELSPILSGEVATYIPELGRADPEHFGICVATVDGQQYAVGDVDHEITIQSVSKPFMYGAALQALGRERVLTKVGVEPTGETFNSIVLDEEHNRPFNPMVNAGAIATSELMQGSSPAEREANMLGLFSRFAGRELRIDADVFRSEQATGHRNRAIAYMMLNAGMIDRDPEDVLDLYFKQCSVLVSCRDLALMGATLAAHGTNPKSGERVLEPEVVRDVLSVMSSCGMYDYAGQWGFDVGLPAKSGVSGGIVAVVPGQLGIAVYSPRLDKVGNSVRGVKACKRFAEDFALHAFSEGTDARSAIRREYRANEVRSKRIRDEAEREVIQTAGERIVVLELQGPLFFGATERVARRITELTSQAETFVLDFQRVVSIDKGSLRLFRFFVDSLQDRAPRLVLTNTEGRAFLEDFRDLMGKAEVVETLRDIDTALERFEEEALEAAGAHSDQQRLKLGGHEIFDGLDQAEIAALEGIASTLSFEAGEHIIHAGDEAKALLTLASGSVSICVVTGQGNLRRVASVGPGQSFGEMALLDGGVRSAEVFADSPVLCYAFSVDRIRELCVEHPQLLSKMFGNLVRSLSVRLRLANEEIQAME